MSIICSTCGFQKVEYLQVRRRFQRRYAKYIIGSVGLGLGGAGVLVFFCPLRVLVAGFLLGFLVIVYLVQPNFMWQKEVGAALLYTLGIALPTLSLGVNFGLGSLHFILSYFGLVLFNILLFAYFERQEDKIQERNSWVVSCSAGRVRLILGILLALIYVELGFARFHVGESAWSIFLFMTIILSLPFLAFRFFRIEERYRIVGDSIFLIPIIDLI